MPLSEHGVDAAVEVRREIVSFLPASDWASHQPFVQGY